MDALEVDLGDVTVQGTAATDSGDGARLQHSTDFVYTTPPRQGVDWQEPPPPTRPRYKFPVRQALLAALLLVVGIVMTTVGVVNGPFAVMLVGTIALLPGAYQSWVLIQTVRRKPGYRVEETYEMVEI